MNIPEQGKVHAVLLAAGLSSRMGDTNKLLVEIGGEAMVRRVARALVAAEPAGVVVVTGHERRKIEQAMQGLAVEVSHNPDFATGLSSSLRQGLRTLPPDAAGALIALGDMPYIGPSDYRLLMVAFQRAEGRSIVRATNGGRPGNPVILPRILFPAAMALDGDRGAREIIRSGKYSVVDVEIGAAAARDVDSALDLEGDGEPI